MIWGKQTLDFSRPETQGYKWPEMQTSIMVNGEEEKGAIIVKTE